MNINLTAYRVNPEQRSGVRPEVVVPSVKSRLQVSYVNTDLYTHRRIEVSVIEDLPTFLRVLRELEAQGITRVVFHEINASGIVGHQYYLKL